MSDTQKLNKKSGRKPRKQPSKAEKLEMCQQAMAELEHIRDEVNQEKAKIASLGLTRIPELVEQTLEDLAEDIDEIKESMKHIQAEPDTENLI